MGLLLIVCVVMWNYCLSHCHCSLGKFDNFEADCIEEFDRLTGLTWKSIEESRYVIVIL